MKTYIVYFLGVEVGYVKAANHNAAEKKARKKWGDNDINSVPKVSVAYTEL